MEKKAIVISFINLKGGVGKTSSAVNVADELSRKHFKTLVIDMDPQFNATQALLNHQFRYARKSIDESLFKKIITQFDGDIGAELAKDEEGSSQEDENAKEYNKTYKEEITSQLIYSELKDQNSTIRSLFKSELLVEPLSNPSLVYNIKTNLDLIPGDLDLFETLSGDTSGKHNILDDHFDNHNIRSEYDFIIIDCPPNWTILTQASLFSSDYYITPSKIDLFSSVGIGLLENLVNSTFYEKKSPISKIYSVYRRELSKQPVRSLGVLFTLTHEMSIENKLKRKLQDEIEQTFFDAEIPYHSSVPLKFSLYNESGDKHHALKNAIEKVVEEIIARSKKETSEKEGETCETQQR